MKVLDLFSGLKGWSEAFEDRGHKVTTVDIEPRFKPTILNDIMNLTPKDFEKYGQFDIILASPPCNCFSVMSISRHWNKDKTPKEDTKKAIQMIGHTIELILNLHPRWWILENPRGMMRRVLGKPSVETTFAAWLTLKDIEFMSSKSGKEHFNKNYFVKKPTDLWGVIPKRVKWKEPKKWEYAPRGSRKGIQGIKRADLRAKIPYGLSLAICLACEKEITNIGDKRA